jgi:hypothetical protein
MAKKQNTKIGTEVKGAPVASAAPTKTSTPVRNSAIPKVSAAAIVAPKAEITHDVIAQRAYEISQSGGGSEFDNWLRAERELLGL